MRLGDHGHLNRRLFRLQLREKKNIRNQLTSWTALPDVQLRRPFYGLLNSPKKKFDENETNQIGQK